MVKLKAQLICLVIVFASCKVYCDHFPDPALSDECGRMCNESTVPMEDSQVRLIVISFFIYFSASLGKKSYREI